MRKSFPLILAFVLVISIFIIMIQENRFSNTAAYAVEKAFSETGAAVVSSEIYVRGTSKRKVLGENDARSLLENIVSGTGAMYSKDIPVFNNLNNDYTEGIEVNYIIDENKTVQMSVLNDINEAAVKNSNLIISFFDTSENPSIQDNAAAITDSLEKYGIDYEVNISVTGCVDGRLKDDEIDDICSRAFRSIGADMVEGIDDNGLLSVSAFSPSISESVSVNGKKVNMSMAARYNSYEAKTYIWLATPVITTEY